MKRKAQDDPLLHNKTNKSGASYLKTTDDIFWNELDAMEMDKHGEKGYRQQTGKDVL